MQIIVGCYVLIQWPKNQTMIMILRTLSWQKVTEYILNILKKKLPFNIELYFKKRLINLYANLTKKPIKDILKKLRSRFKTYREAFTTTISLFTKMQYENNAVVQKIRYIL